MKKLLLVALLACGILLVPQAQAQTPYLVQSQTMTATGALGGLATTGVTAVNLKWSGSGTQTTCTVAVDSSSDNVSWSAGAVIGNTTCTATSGSVTVYNVTAANFMRINLGTLTGAGNTVVFTLTAYTTPGAAPANILVLSTGSITPSATSAAIQTVGQTATLTGVASGDQIIPVSYPAATSLCPMTNVRATAANQITIYYTVLTAGACTPAAGTYIFMVIR